MQAHSLAVPRFSVQGREAARYLDERLSASAFS